MPKSVKCFILYLRFTQGSQKPITNLPKGSPTAADDEREWPPGYTVGLLTKDHTEGENENEIWTQHAQCGYHELTI